MNIYLRDVAIFLKFHLQNKLRKANSTAENDLMMAQVVNFDAGSRVSKIVWTCNEQVRPTV